MREDVRRDGYGYLVALVATAAVGLFRYALSGLLGETAPTIPFVVPVILAAWYGGLRPGLLATALGALVGACLFVPPHFSLIVISAAEAVALGVFVVCGVTISVLCEALHRARRRAEAEAGKRGRAEERLRVTLLSVGDGLITTDAAGRVATLNPVAEQLTGWPKAEAAGKPLEEVFVIVNEESRRPVENPALRALKEGAIVGLANHTLLIARGGAERPIDDSAAPVRDAEGRVVGTVLVFRDITERKRAEAALRAADRRKDEFLATLSHELRGPLAPIHNAVQVLQRAELPEPFGSAREVIDRQVRQMAAIIDDLLDVSRITMGKLELRPQPCDLESVVRHAVETARPYADAAGHALTVRLPPEPVRLNADLTRLAQVFANLLTNACKYTERGGRISLSAVREGDDLVVAVRDNGIGIAPEHLPSLFEKFAQITPALERSQGGLGIGLALVRGLVEMHGGTVSAHSAGPGRGSEFVVRLPAPAGRDAPTQAPLGDGRGANPSAARRRILVVDDNRDSAESLAMLLRLGGCEVATAHDGLGGVEAADRFRPDVILMDIGMPRLNGYDACCRIRAQSWGRDMVLIALTGWGSESDRRRTEEVGFDSHLVKPIEYDALTRLIATLPGKA